MDACGARHCSWSKTTYVLSISQPSSYLHGRNRLSLVSLVLGQGLSCSLSITPRVGSALPAPAQCLSSACVPGLRHTACEDTLEIGRSHTRNHEQERAGRVSWSFELGDKLFLSLDSPATLNLFRYCSEVDNTPCWVPRAFVLESKRRPVSRTLHSFCWQRIGSNPSYWSRPPQQESNCTENSWQHLLLLAA